MFPVNNYYPMKFVLILICQSFLFIASAQQVLEDNYINDCKGKVKECTETSYSRTYGSNIQDTAVSIKSFDENGRVNEFRSSIPGVPTKLDRYELSYSKSGQLREIRNFYHDGNYSGRLVFDSDKQGNIIEQTEYASNFGRLPKKIIKYKYDNNNRLIEAHKHTGDPIVNNNMGKLEDDYYEYDKKGFPVKTTAKINDRNLNLTGGWIYEFENDTSGKLLVKYFIAKENTRVKREANTYYETGLLREKFVYMEAFKWHYRYEYEYDQNGNWTKRIEHASEPNNKETDKTTIRKIIYY